MLSEVITVLSSERPDHIHMAKLLEKLGFIHSGSGQFHHRMIDRVIRKTVEFDFSASSIFEGVICRVYQDGIKAGEEKIKHELRKLLDIK